MKTDSIKYFKNSIHWIIDWTIASDVQGHLSIVCRNTTPHRLTIIFLPMLLYFRSEHWCSFHLGARVRPAPAQVAWLDCLLAFCLLCSVNVLCLLHLAYRAPGENVFLVSDADVHDYCYRYYKWCMIDVNGRYFVQDVLGLFKDKASEITSRLI